MYPLAGRTIFTFGLAYGRSSRGVARGKLLFASIFSFPMSQLGENDEFRKLQRSGAVAECANVMFIGFKLADVTDSRHFAGLGCPTAHFSDRYFFLLLSSYQLQALPHRKCDIAIVYPLRPDSMNVPHDLWIVLVLSSFFSLNAHLYLWSLAQKEKQLLQNRDVGIIWHINVKPATRAFRCCIALLLIPLLPAG